MTTARPTGKKATSSAARPQAERLLDAMAHELDMLYRLTVFLGDEDISADDVIEWLGQLATHARVVVEPGRERAWLLATLLSLLGADARHEARSRDKELPALEASSPMPVKDMGIAGEDVERLDDALRGLDKRTRAAVLLVVHEGLTIDDAVRVQGGSRRTFARRYASGLALLPEESIDRLMGRRELPHPPA